MMFCSWTLDSTIALIQHCIRSLLIALFECYQLQIIIVSRRIIIPHQLYCESSTCTSTSTWPNSFFLNLHIFITILHT